jgi:hypothetical protein
MVEKWNMIPLFQFTVVFDCSKPADLTHCSENKFIDFKIIIPAMSIGLKAIKRSAMRLRLNLPQPE